MAEKRRLAIAIDPAFEKINLSMLRNLVWGADTEGFRDDSTFEIFYDEPFGKTFLVLNEVTP